MDELTTITREVVKLTAPGKRTWQHPQWEACRGWRNDDNQLQRCDQGEVAHYRSGRCRRCSDRYDACQEARSERREARQATATPAAAVAPVPPLAPPAPPVPSTPPPVPPAPPAVTPLSSGTAGTNADLPAFTWTLVAQRGGTPNAALPVITLTRNGVLQINPRALALWPRATTAVQVYVDEARQALAIQPCAGDASGARGVRGDTKSRAGLVSVTALPRLLDWWPTATVRLTPRLMDGMLVVIVSAAGPQEAGAA